MKSNYYIKTKNHFELNYLRDPIFKTCLLTFGLVMTAQNALAQQPIGAGGQIQQIPRPATSERALPDLRIQKGNVAPNPTEDLTTIRVSALHISGQTQFSEADLIAASGFKGESDLSLSQLRAMAAKISAFYNQRGYFVAQAYLPAQDITGGTVAIVVIEGHYGQINLNNDTNLSNGVAHNILSGLNRGDVVASAPLERRLLLLSDIPGVAVHSSLAPGTAVGDSDLTINLVPTPRVTGSLEADNAGNRYTGANRVGAAIDVNDPTGHGDQLSLRGLTSGSGLTYVRGAYQTQVHEATLGMAYAKLWYELSKEFSSLHATGTAEYISLYGSEPLIRSRRTNLYGLANIEHRTFQDKVGTTSSVTNKQSDVLELGLAGDHRDRLGGGGANTYSLTWTTGKLDIQTAEVRAFDQISARTHGHYNKLAGSVSRVQTLGGPFSLYGLIRGQVADKNLDISEKMELGGAYAVRAYPEGEAYGDQGYVATLEGRMTLPLSHAVPGRLQLIAFADAGQVDLVHSAWVLGPNSQRRSGGGVGLTWADNNCTSSEHSRHPARLPANQRHCLHIAGTQTSHRRFSKGWGREIVCHLPIDL